MLPVQEEITGLFRERERDGERQLTVVGPGLSVTIIIDRIIDEVCEGYFCCVVTYVLIVLLVPLSFSSLESN